MNKWQPIETAPKEITAHFENHEYGAYIMAWPVGGGVGRARWWQWRNGDGRIDGSNFIADGGNACYPTHWMPLPEPPPE